MRGLPGFRILPVLMVFAAICFGVRFSEVMANVSDRGYETKVAGKLSEIGSAAGEDAPAQPPEDQLKGQDESGGGKTVKKEAPPKDAAAAPAKPDVTVPSMAPAEQKVEDWKASDDLDDEYSDVKMELFTDLSKRRKDLEAKEKELAMREALIKAAQAELQQKTDELNGIKSDIEALLKQQTDQEDKRIASLVKIYEGMKAKDAARIFDSLEMDVLLQVMTKMSERKSAPILAAMSPERARNVTTLLAEQNKLPDLPMLPAQ